MAISQISTSNTFQQWLTSTQLLIEHANFFQNTSNAVFETANLVYNTANTVAANLINTVNANVAAELANVNANVAAELANVNANVNANLAAELANGNVNVKVSNTTTNSTFYITFANASSGAVPNFFVSSSKLYYNPNTGTISSTSFNSLSDETFKTNVIVIDNAIDVVNQLNGVKFTWVENNKESYGLIAQELEKVIPQLVEGDEIKTINYNGIIAFLINAIKELSRRIDNLENK